MASDPSGILSEAKNLSVFSLKRERDSSVAAATSEWQPAGLFPRLFPLLT
jgi:hypothetical protein